MTEEQFVKDSKAWQRKAVAYYLRHNRKLMRMIRRRETIRFIDFSDVKHMTVWHTLMRRHGYWANVPYLRYEHKV